MTTLTPKRIADLVKFKPYRRKQIAELRPWREGDDMARVSVSAPDMVAGSPKAGDMIARNPRNHDDQWLVAAKYFADNFEAADALSTPPPASGVTEERYVRCPTCDGGVVDYEAAGKVCPTCKGQQTALVDVEPVTLDDIIKTSDGRVHNEDCDLLGSPCYCEQPNEK